MGINWRGRMIERCEHNEIMHIIEGTNTTCHGQFVFNDTIYAASQTEWLSQELAQESLVGLQSWLDSKMKQELDRQRRPVL